MQSTIETRQIFYQKLLKFPPFFTLQEHEETRKKQLMYWGEILINYFKRNNIINSSVSEIMQLSIIEDKSTSVSKKLNKEEITAILKNLQSLGNVEWKQNTAFEFADEIYAWAKKNYLINDVETINFISNGKNTSKTDKFYNQPKEIILKAIAVLEKQGKAQLIDMGSDYSVKFL